MYGTFYLCLVTLSKGEIGGRILMTVYIPTNDHMSQSALPKQMIPFTHLIIIILVLIWYEFLPFQYQLNWYLSVNNHSMIQALYNNSFLCKTIVVRRMLSRKMLKSWHENECDKNQELWISWSFNIAFEVMKQPFSTTCFKDFTNNFFHKGLISFYAGYCDIILKHLSYITNFYFHSL